MARDGKPDDHPSIVAMNAALTADYGCDEYYKRLKTRMKEITWKDKEE